ncbi:MAG: adenylosuccinate lyase [Methanomassiliicoccales archaeon]
MLLCPLDYRYGRQEMKSIFTEEKRLENLLKVEAALSMAHAQVGNIPQEAAEEIASNANLDRVTKERVGEIEAETRHDMMALVRALTEQCKDGAGNYVHLGATSNDIIDTATALQLSEAIDVVERDLLHLVEAMARLAKEHRDTVMIGRTHGQFAIPITFGFKVAGYLAEVIRYADRLREMAPRIRVGKMSGAVGTGAALGPEFLKIQDSVMEQLGLSPEPVATQLVGRDRYSELISLMSQLATSCERYATEIRNLQRSEIREVYEAFDTEKQVGSSTMAHKKNPILAENICGLARITRSFLTPTLENMVLWHERDLTNSSSERFILPHVMVLIDDILHKTGSMFSSLAVDPDRMIKNLESSNGKVMAESVMIALVEKGMGRQDAHELVRKCSMRADEEDRHLEEVLSKSDEAREYLSEREVEAAMDPSNYLGSAGELVDSMVAKAKIVIGKEL